MYPNEPTDYRRIFLAIALAAVVLTAWQVFFEWPRRQQLAAFHAEQAKLQAKAQDQYAATAPLRESDSENLSHLSREERLVHSQRITIASDKLHGSIALSGARFDDLTLAKYRDTQAKDSNEVVLLSPNGGDLAYFAQVGWVAADGKTIVPDQKTQWQSDEKKLTPETPVTLTWNNGQNVTYKLIVSLDKDYMFSIEQQVHNHSGSAIDVVPYGYINRTHNMPNPSDIMLHEGPLGIVEGGLKEIHYDELKENGNQTFEKSSSWVGITDKYWLTAIVPSFKNFKTTYSYYQKGGLDRYQVDYTADKVTVENGGNYQTTIRIFAGAKEIRALDRYTDGGNGFDAIPLFDRAVDFGSLYFLTKPLFLMLNFFYAMIGNFGLAILLLTVVVKLCLYPLASKSFRAMSQMKRLQPEMEKIKERCGDDRVAMQKEMLALYKREKVNPASGCLPLLIQMPVFFALYRVFLVTIEMRHAPFFGWLKDLSAPDPTNIFTLFGTMPWDHPGWLNVSILPMLMCATMVIQMRQQPTPPDPMQAKMMKIMPYFFLFMFGSFPAGLVLYWTWSNVLSILQQYIIAHRHGEKKPKNKHEKTPEKKPA